MVIPHKLSVGIVILVTSASAFPHGSSPVRAEANDNRRAAGTFRNGVLTVALEVRAATWYPDGDQLPGASVEAFGEVGKTPSVPGPLLRVPAGTQIRASLRNSLPRDTITFYLPAKLSRNAPSDQLDSLVVPPGADRPLRISSTRPGTYLYRAVSGRRGTGRQVLRIDALLGGALVVDSAGVTGPSRDRVMVMQALSLTSDTTALSPVMAINGRSWPHTERLLASFGDKIRWRVINASPEIHPMHLHGFYYRVDAFDSESDNSADGALSSGKMVVTQRMPPASTMAISWVPERAGNWLFHCHFQRHIVPHQPLTGLSSPAPSTSHDHVADHALTAMNGLVVGILVTDKSAGQRRSSATSQVQRRKVRLVAIRDTNLPDSLPSMRFVLEEDGAPRKDAGVGFSPAITLFRGEPVSIMVVNHMTEPTAVHWHGIELESYFDGVPGFSGAGVRRAPIIAPQDSFEVLMTPPRSGTFIYHSHVDEPRQQRAGLAGPLIVRDRTDMSTRDDVILFIKNARDGGLDGPEFEINGKANPDTLVLQVGRQYRLRLIGLQVTNPNAETTVTARADSVVGNPRDTLLVQWRPLAKDGIELPGPEQTLRDARQVVPMGETYDFAFVPIKPGHLRMEVRVSVPRPRLMVRLPIRVE
jgi:FtsP/CotA-like multicopper oxidase with cupredoxin domain